MDEKKDLKKDFEINIQEFKKYRNRKKYREIKKDLLDQLDRNSVYGKQFNDLIEDYMDMWITKTLLMEDIKERGVRVFYNNGGGQCGYKKNESVDQYMKINTQMLKLLGEIGLEPDQEAGEEDEL